MNTHKTSNLKFLMSGSVLQNAITCQKHHCQHMHTSVPPKYFNRADSVHGPLNTRQSGLDN